MTGTIGPYSEQRSRQNSEARAGIVVILSPGNIRGAGLDFWNRHADILCKYKLLTDQTVSAFIEICCTHAALIAIREQIERDGRVVVNFEGRSCRHVLYSQEKWHADRLLSYLKEFGLTGASQKRLGVPVKPNEDYDPAA